VRGRSCSTERKDAKNESNLMEETSVCLILHLLTLMFLSLIFSTSGKTSDGRVVIQRFKELPVGVPNPAASATPRIKPGDFIIGINGVRQSTFADCVLAIRSSTGAVEMELERLM
jgi:PDZ domain